MLSHSHPVEPVRKRSFWSYTALLVWIKTTNLLGQVWRNLTFCSSCAPSINVHKQKPVSISVSSLFSCTVVLYNPRKNRQNHIINSAKKTITSVGFSEDGRYLVPQSRLCSTALWAKTLQSPKLWSEDDLATFQFGNSTKLDRFAKYKLD